MCLIEKCCFSRLENKRPCSSSASPPSVTHGTVINTATVARDPQRWIGISPHAPDDEKTVWINSKWRARIEERETERAADSSGNESEEEGQIESQCVSTWLPGGAKGSGDGLIGIVLGQYFVVYLISSPFPLISLIQCTKLFPFISQLIDAKQLLYLNQNVEKERERSVQRSLFQGQQILNAFSLGWCWLWRVGSL